MKIISVKPAILTFLFTFFSCFQLASQAKTIVTIKGDDFYINNEITLNGRSIDGISIEGLLPNSRMVQGIFDDLNPETQSLWKYPDTHEWDANRNTSEFIAAMPEWRKNGLLAFTLNIQGGSPTGYGNKGWINPGFHKDGQPMEAYFERLERIVTRADELGMAVILGVFYFGQDEHLENEEAVKNALINTVDWLFSKGFRNVIIEINNECNIKSYDHEILKPERVHELIELAKSKQHPVSGYSLYVGTSYGGGHIPHPNVVKVSDFLLLHGNGVSNPEDITKMVEETRKVDGYHSMPVLFNEDDHFDFDKPVNNMLNAFRAGASWGFFDFRKRGETLAEMDSSFSEGYQSIPVDWGINSHRKKDFFGLLRKISGIKEGVESLTVPGFMEYVYKQIDTVSLKIFIKNPERFNEKETYPVIVFFFGGGWNSGDIKQFKPHAEYFSSRGMIAVLADYRVRNRHHTTPFEAVSDAKSVIRYLRQNSEFLRIDTSKIVASGGSAGGHLAAATATVPGLNDSRDDLKINAKPNALVLFNPVFDNGPTGYGYDRIGERYPEISPLHNSQNNTPPTIVFLGTKDDLIPVKTARLYKRKMEKSGGRCDLFLYKDQKHGFFNYREDSKNENRFFKETIAQTDHFLESLGNVTGQPSLLAH